MDNKNSNKIVYTCIIYKTCSDDNENDVHV